MEPWWADARIANFVCGLLAGLCAKLVTHPMDVAKKRYQVAGLQRSLRCVRCTRIQICEAYDCQEICVAPQGHVKPAPKMS